MAHNFPLPVSCFLKSTPFQLFGRDFRHPLFILASIVPGIHAHIRSLFDIIAQLTGGPGAKLYNGIYAAVDGRIAERVG